MSNLKTLIKKDIMEQVRSKKAFIYVIVFLFLALASPIFAKLMPEIFKNLSNHQGIIFKLPKPTYLDAIDQFFKNGSQLVLYLLIFVVAGSVADEKTRKTLEMVLVKPVSKDIFILSKFISYLLTTGVFFVISALIFFLYTVSIFKSFNMQNFFIASSLLYLYILLILFITIFVSTISRNAVIAGVVGFASTFALSAIPNSLAKIADYSPGFILTHYKVLINRGWSGDFLLPTIISLLLITLLIFLSTFIFRRQEIER